jgi:transcription initiation factor TFIIIB Brf1 subunit/transcription initiation factor TFIIB
MKLSGKIWKCECGNEDQAKIIIASDGEVVCEKCGTVLDHVPTRPERGQEDIDSWDAESDLYRKILEDRVSKRGWDF